MAKTVGVTIGRYHPFHRGHEVLIRKLAREYDKVYVFVAGNRSGKKNPFPFSIRKKIINLSLKDTSNVKLHMAMYTDDDGKIRHSAYIPALVSRLKLKKDDTLHLLVGNDRFMDFKSQIEREKAAGRFPVKSVQVVKMPNVSVDNDAAARISGTEVRSLLIGGNKEEVRKRMSQNLGQDFDDIYSKLRMYLGKYYRLHESAFFLKEAEALATLKGISHVEDMPPMAFLKFLQKWHNTEIDGGLEISEKVDGSAQISFGVSKGKVYAKSKYGKPLFSPNSWPKIYIYDALRNAHYALDAVKDKIAMLKLIPNLKNPDGYDIVVDKKRYKDAIYPQYFTEVLWTRIPNALEYGDNILMVYGVKVQGSHIPSSSFEKKVLKELIGLMGRGTTVKGAKWRFENKIVLSKDKFQINTKVEYKKLKDILGDLKNQEILLKRARTTEEKKAKARLLTKIKKIQLGLKSKFLNSLRSMTPTFGKEGGVIEGIVVKDLESGAMIKVVDKDMFTAINQFFWHYRELLGKGVKIGGEWKKGAGTVLKEEMADQVFGVPALKTPSASKFVKTRIDKYSAPKEVQTSNAIFNWKLYRFLTDESAAGGKSANSMVSESIKIIDKVMAKINALHRDWEKDKQGELTKSITNEKGKVVKIIKMPQEIIGRTDKAFEMTKKEMEQLKSRITRFTGMVKTPEAKKTILFKLFLGKKNLAKIRGV